MLPFPFHFLNNNGAMNVKPANYSWQTFYDQIIELTRYYFSTRATFRRFLATQGVTARWVNLVGAVSMEGFGRARYYREIRHRLDTDPQFLPYFEQESSVLPQFYKSIVRQDLGPLMEWLPEGALYHDPNAYLKADSADDAYARSSKVPPPPSTMCYTNNALISRQSSRFHLLRFRCRQMIFVGNLSFGATEETCPFALYKSWNR